MDATAFWLTVQLAAATVVTVVVAAGILALRANDHRYDVVPYTFGSGPGVYQATPPAFANPINTNAPITTPFARPRGYQPAG